MAFLSFSLSRRSIPVMLLASSIALSACSDKPEEPAASQKEDTVLQPQIEALNKAKQVDELMQQEAERQRKKMEEAGAE